MKTIGLASRVNETWASRFKHSALQMFINSLHFTFFSLEDFAKHEDQFEMSWIFELGIVQYFNKYLNAYQNVERYKCWKM